MCGYLGGARAALAGRVLRAAPRLPLEVHLHEPLLAVRLVARPQQRLPHVAGVGLVEAHARVRVLYRAGLQTSF